MNQTLIPDSDGAVFLRGMEQLAHTYNIKDQILKSVQSELEAMKRELRNIAGAAAQQAARAGGMVRRVMLLGLRGTAVSIGVTDPEKPGNRNSIGKKEMDEVMKLGGLATIGLPPEQIFEHTEAEPPRIVLTGVWYSWFDEGVLAPGKVSEEQLGHGKGVEVLPAEPGKLKLSAGGVGILRKVLETGSDAAKQVAAFLLNVGVKAFSVTPDFGEK